VKVIWRRTLILLLENETRKEVYWQKVYESRQKEGSVRFVTGVSEQTPPSERCPPKERHLRVPKL